MPSSALKEGILQIYWGALASAVGWRFNVQCLSRGYPSCTVRRWVVYQGPESISSEVVVSACALQVDLYKYTLIKLPGMNVQHSRLCEGANFKLGRTTEAGDRRL